MQIWLVNWLPKEIFLLLAPISLMVIGFLVEKYYTGRITLFANAMALVSFFGVFTNIPTVVVIYINLATVLGIIGLISYAVKHPLIEAYYHVGKLVSSVITGVVLLWGATAGLT
jgi:hypothetical protein